MKIFQKLFFATALVAMTSGALMSCSSDDDDAPITITPAAVPELDEGTTSYILTGKVSAEAGLILVKYYRVDAEGVETPINKSIEFPTAVTEYDINLVVTDLVTGDNEIKIEVTDKSPRKVSSIVNIKVKGDPLALTAAVEFKLGHPGTDTNPNTLMGITYEQNLPVPANTAKFKGFFVMLADQTAYNALTTKAALKAAYTAGTNVASFIAPADDDFINPIFLIVKDGETYRLVKMTALNFVADANVATFTEKH